MIRVRARKIVTLGVATEVNTAATIRAVVVKNISVPVRGYIGAVRRLEAAVARGDATPDDVFIAIFEAGNWLSSIAKQPGLTSDPLVRGLNFARNRTHHQFASIAEWDGRTWIWRVANLPEPVNERHRDEKRRPLYEQHLAGNPVLDVFRRLEPKVTALAPEAT
jgi:hypothetical protein